MINQTIEAKTCLACSKPLKGRIDKKFCDDYCRSSFNNKHNNLANPVLRNINNSLKRNRRILEEFLHEGERTVKIDKNKLIEKGFNFKYITHMYKNKKGVLCYYCYDYGYVPLDNNFYFVIKQNDGC